MLVLMCSITFSCFIVWEGFVTLLVNFTSILLPIVQVGYIVTSSLLNENHDFLRLAINAVRNDIIGRNETFQCLALTMVWLSITCI